MRYASLGVWRMVRTLLPVLLITAAMYAAVLGMGRLMADAGVAVRLLSEIATGVVVYTLLALALRLEAMGEVRSLIRKIIS